MVSHQAKGVLHPISPTETTAPTGHFHPSNLNDNCSRCRGCPFAKAGSVELVPWRKPKKEVDCWWGTRFGWWMGYERSRQRGWRLRCRKVKKVFTAGGFRIVNVRTSISGERTFETGIDKLLQCTANLCASCNNLTIPISGEPKFQIEPNSRQLTVKCFHSDNYRNVITILSVEP